MQVLFYVFLFSASVLSALSIIKISSSAAALGEGNRLRFLTPWYLISPKYITTVEILHCALSGVDFMMIGCNGWDILFSFVNRSIFKQNVSILKKKSACSKSACSKKREKANICRLTNINLLAEYKCSRIWKWHFLCYFLSLLLSGTIACQSTERE